MNLLARGMGATADRARTLAFLRLVLLASLVTLVGTSGGAWGAAFWAVALVHALTNVVVLWPRRDPFANLWMTGALFLADIALVTAVLGQTGAGQGHLLVAFFLTLLMAGLGRTMAAAILIAVASSAVYLLFVPPEQGEPGYLLDFARKGVVLFAAALYATFLAQETARGKDQGGAPRKVERPKGYYARVSWGREPGSAALSWREETRRAWRERTGDWAAAARVNAAIEGALRLAQTHMAYHGVGHVELLDGSDPRVAVDPRALEDVLLNLIAHSVEQMRESSVRCLTLETRAQAGEVHLVVSCPPAAVPAGESASGTGVGLAICRQIVERHGGRFSVTHREGEGSEFRVILPRWVD